MVSVLGGLIRVVVLTPPFLVVYAGMRRPQAVALAVVDGVDVVALVEAVVSVPQFPVVAVIAAGVAFFLPSLPSQSEMHG